MTQALEILEPVLGAAIDEVAVQAELVDVRRRARGRLRELWEELADLAPGELTEQFPNEDLAPTWGPVYRRLLVALEHALSELG